MCSRAGSPRPLCAASAADLHKHAELHEHTVDARMRASTMFAVTPSECATAVGVRSREAIFGKTGLQKLRLWRAARGLYAFRKGSSVGPKDPSLREPRE